MPENVVGMKRNNDYGDGFHTVPAFIKEAFHLEQKIDKRMQDILEIYENNSLGLDDTFQFKCRGCGKCCKNREDILLTARDLYNIAGHLGRTVEYIVDRYCEVYVGDASRLPIVRLKPSGPEKVCPLLRDRRCIVHKAKPVVCALFPLGRGTSMTKTDGGIETSDRFQPRYFVQPASCGTPDHTQTVRSWLEQFGIPAEDEFHKLWTEAITIISEFLRSMEAREITEKTMELCWNAAIFGLYMNYDPKNELIPQFRENAVKLLAVFNDISAMAEK